MTKKDAIKYLQQLYPNGGHCWLDEQRIEAIGMAIQALQEEPVSEDMEEASRNYADNEEYGDDVYFAIKAAFKVGAKWQKEQMMAKAIFAVVSQVPCSNEIILYNPSSVDKYYLPQEMNKLGLNKGDKIKLVIIKKD